MTNTTATPATIWSLVSDRYTTEVLLTTDPAEEIRQICAPNGWTVPRLREQADYIEDAYTGEVLFRRVSTGAEGTPLRWLRTHTDGAFEVLSLIQIDGLDGYAVQVTADGDDFVGLYDLDGDAINLSNMTWTLCSSAPAEAIESVANGWETGTTTVVPWSADAERDALERLQDHQETLNDLQALARRFAVTYPPPGDPLDLQLDLRDTRDANKYAEALMVLGAARRTWRDLQSDETVWAVDAGLASPSTLAALAGDSATHVRDAVAKNPATPPSTLAALAGDSATHVRLVVARHAATPPSTLVALAGDSEWTVRHQVAVNPHTPRATLTTLANDIEWPVRYFVVLNAATTLETLASLTADVDPNVRRTAHFIITKRRQTTSHGHS
jgi:hypothetical protein